jgi:hypothetical protein
MTPLVARSFDEAEMYLQLQICEVCGRVALEQQPGVAGGQLDGEPVTWLATVCANCGNRTRFAFRLPAEAAVAPPGQVLFGGGGPSQLIDPGQWLRMADVVTQRLPPQEELSPHLDPALRDRVHLAAAAVAEVLRFIKPGEDRVPGYEFWTDSGRQMYDEARWRFDKESLEFELDRYRRALATLDGR